MNNRLGLVVLLLAQILALHVKAHESDQAQAPLTVLNPFEHKAQTGVQLHVDDQNSDHKVAVSGAIEESPSSSEEKSGESNEAAEAPQIRRMGKHHSSDRSVAGGGVIIGGLVTAIFAAVFCYIRVTRRRDTRY
ncbi:hypothetical protein D0Y65_016224 [Glycine soja]|uniref:Transmembrane protein n=1 Tax=Glycine soja TaxID=3848 RepID=A0A445KG58_GLYSO|nr:hypothetical protein glysoja_017231 [Glycine soja]RZC09788.1 hypothetical protein D0Y65_016224 [Glycine soja]